MKQRGVTVEAAGDPGLTKANHQFLKPVEIPWEGATTLAALFEQSCQKHSAQSALGTREYIKKEVEITPDGKCFDKLTLGAYKWISYKEVLDQASCFASGLVALGHRRNERCAIFAETCAEWFIALQGCFRQSVTVVTMYASLGEDAVAYSFNETEVSTVICDRKQFKKLADARMKLKTIKRVVIMDDPADTSEVVCPCLVNWALNAISDIKKLGKEKPVPAKMPAASEIALIMYTSGSTGLPKGVVMTHGNIVAAVAGELRVTPNLGPNDRYLAYLPLAHVFELTGECALFSAGSGLGYGSPLTLTDTSSKIKKGTKGDAAELKPTLLVAVPAILDRIRDEVRNMVETKGGLTKTLFDLAYGRSLTALEGNGSVFWGIEKQLWDNLIFKKVRASLGGSIKCILSGGAPLSRDTQWFINICFGVLIGQGYGLTETCGGGTISEWDDICVGRVGSPAPQCYVKLVNWEEGGYRTTDNPMPRGEIVIGGPSVTLGYFNNQSKTDEVYKTDESGTRWFRTGDIGQFHPDGCLEIIDRKKDIVKLQHGEYISLGKVEAALVASTYVDSIMMHADPFRSYCVAIVVATQEVVESWAQKESIEHTNFVDLCNKEETRKEIIKSLQQVAKMAKLEKYEMPRKIKILADPWTPESGLVTASLKLKRENIKKAFASELKDLYA